MYYDLQRERQEPEHTEAQTNDNLEKITSLCRVVVNKFLKDNPDVNHPVLKDEVSRTTR